MTRETRLAAASSGFSRAGSLLQGPACDLGVGVKAMDPPGRRVRRGDQSFGNCPMRPIISVTICRSSRNCSVVLNSLSL
jgi:hypothetical protein